MGKGRMHDSMVLDVEQNVLEFSVAFLLGSPKPRSFMESLELCIMEEGPFFPVVL